MRRHVAPAFITIAATLALAMPLPAFAGEVEPGAAVHGGAVPTAEDVLAGADTPSPDDDGYAGDGVWFEEDPSARGDAAAGVDIPEGDVIKHMAETPLANSDEDVSTEDGITGGGSGVADAPSDAEDAVVSSSGDTHVPDAVNPEESESADGMAESDEATTPAATLALPTEDVAEAPGTAVTPVVAPASPATSAANPAKAASKAPASTSKAAKKVAKAASKKTLAAGWYTVKTTLNKAYALYVKGLKKKSGTAIVLKKAAPSHGFAFKLEKQGSYYRVLVGISTGRSVQLVSNRAASGAKGAGDLYRLAYQKKLKGYRLVNVRTGLALAVDGGKAAAGVGLVGQKPKSGAKAQTFTFTKRAGLVEAGVYALKPAQDTDYALTVDGAYAYLYEYMRDFDQKWHVAPVKGKQNVYTIEAIASGKHLAGEAGKQLKVVNAAAAKDQRWKPVASGSCITWKNVATAKHVSTYGQNWDEGSAALNSSYFAPITRKFKMAAVPAVESGVYTLHLAANTGLGLAVAGGSKAADAAAQAASGKDENAQKWYYDAAKHTLINVNSGLVLDAKSTKAGAALVQRKAHGAKTHSWTFEYVGGGNFKVVNGAGSRVLGASAASAGSSARGQKDSGKAAQRWKVAPALVSVAPKGFNLITNISNYGHGKLMADYVVIHETANPGASALAHRNLWAGGGYYADYAVHYTLDWTGDCYYCVPENRRCWQVGNGNSHVIGIELCHATSKANFTKVWNAGVQWAAWELKRHNWGIDRLISHDECRTIWGGTDHTDPVGYFAAYGKTWAQFKAAVAKELAA